MRSSTFRLECVRWPSLSVCPSVILEIIFLSSWLCSRLLINCPVLTWSCFLGVALSICLAVGQLIGLEGRRLALGWLICPLRLHQKIRVYYRDFLNSFFAFLSIFIITTNSPRISFGFHQFSSIVDFSRMLRDSTSHLLVRRSIGPSISPSVAKS